MKINDLKSFVGSASARLPLADLVADGKYEIQFKSIKWPVIRYWLACRLLTSDFGIASRARSTSSQMGNTAGRRQGRGTMRVIWGVCMAALAPWALAQAADQHGLQDEQLIAAIEAAFDPIAFERQLGAVGFDKVSTTLGQLGGELYSSRKGAMEQRGATIGMPSVVYANVDTITARGAESASVLTALQAAADLRQPILLESDIWDSAGVEAVARVILGDRIKINSADSALLLATWSGSTWTITRALDDIKAQLGQPESPVQSKAIGGSYVMGPLHRFIDVMYTGNVPVAGYRNIYYATDGTVASWQSLQNPGQCVVGWRGSHVTLDWIHNFINLAHSMSLWHPDWGTPSNATIGIMYHQRLVAKEGYIRNALNNAGCQSVGIVGHSLGGAMSMAHAYRWSYTQPQLFAKFHSIETYNVPRVGNSAYVSDFNARVRSRLTFNAYCRHGDGVSLVPPSPFVNQCTYYGSQVHHFNLFNPLDIFNNHHALYWGQCRSPTSC